MTDKNLEQLRLQGYTIVKQVLSKEEIKISRSYFWDFLEDLGSGIDRTNLETWSDENWPGDIYTGFIGSHGISQSKFAWYVRSRPKVKEAFAKIWRTTDLITSMDTIICWRSWWLCDFEDWEPQLEKAMHIDQNPNYKKGFHCVQGMVPLYDVNNVTGGLQVVPGSHSQTVQDVLRKYCSGAEEADKLSNTDVRDIQKIAQEIDRRSEEIRREEIRPDLDDDQDDESVGIRKFNYDYNVFPIDDPYIKDNIMSKATLLHANAGDLILWDSRLVHSGKGGLGKPYVDSENLKDLDLEKEGLNRLSVPICMMPRKGVSHNVLRMRRLAVKKGCTMTHWANEANFTAGGDSHAVNLDKDLILGYDLTKEEMALV